MRYKFIISLMILLVATVGIYAQQPENKPVRIVDTLTAQEKINRHTILLKTELDSLIKQYAASQEPIQLKDRVTETRNDTSVYLFIALAIVLVLLGWLIYLFYSHRNKFNKIVTNLIRQVQYQELFPNAAVTSSNVSKLKQNDTTGQVKNSKNKSDSYRMTPQTLENKINDLNAEMTKLTKENETLNRVLKEYNGIQHEFDSLKHGIAKVYKIKNYPGYDKSKTDVSVLQGVLETENSVANYAYEKFLKPIFTITDANKNNPAKINEEDREKLLELLVSLSLLYIEYLYLRVNDLSIGGKMVERIESLGRDNGLDPSLLKKLNTEHGSRALVLRMILDKTKLHQLSYPVFDETDLNHQ